MYRLEFLCQLVLLVVINNLNFISVSVPPLKADAPLVVDADAVLAFAISLQPLQPISWKRRKGSDIRCRIEHVQLAKSRALDGPEPPHRVSAEEALGFGAAEGPDHRRRVYWYALNVNRYVLKSVRRADFGFETTLSGRSYLRLIGRLKNQSYSVHFFFLWLSSVDLALSRIKSRVSEGGHDVDVRRRFDEVPLPDDRAIHRTK